MNDFFFSEGNIDSISVMLKLPQPTTYHKITAKRKEFHEVYIFPRYSVFWLKNSLPNPEYLSWKFHEKYLKNI